MQVLLIPLEKICIFMIFARFLLTLRAGKNYEKYIRLVVEILLLTMFLHLILNIL